MDEKIVSLQRINLVESRIDKHNETKMLKLVVILQLVLVKQQMHVRIVLIEFQV